MTKHDKIHFLIRGAKNAGIKNANESDLKTGYSFIESETEPAFYFKDFNVAREHSRYTQIVLSHTKCLVITVPHGFGFFNQIIENE